MDAKAKRLFIISGLVIVLFLGVTAYFIFFQGKKSTNGPLSVDNNLFPFDIRSPEINNLPVINPDGTISTNQPQNEDLVPVGTERLRKVTSFPVSGFVSFSKKSSFTETVLDEKTKKETLITRPITLHMVRYNDQRNGHIFEGEVTNTSILNTKITNTDLPSAEELWFNPNGSSGLLRYEQNGIIQTMRITVPQPPTVPDFCVNNFTVNATIGSKGNSVLLLQKYLYYKLGQNTVADGSYGKKTAASVSQVQKLLTIAETGVFDTTTRDAVNNDCGEIRRLVEEQKLQPQKLTGALLSGYINQMATFGENMFVLRKSNQQISGGVGLVSNGATTEVFKSSFTEWIPQYVNQSLITLTTNASGSVGGYLFYLDPLQKRFSKVLGPLPGLTTLTNPDGTRVMVTVIENDRLVSKIITTSSGAEQTLPFVTFPEKCSWYSSDQLYCGVPLSFTPAQYPDAWYKGLVTFSDALWGFVPSTGRSTQLTAFPESVDVIRMQSDTQNNYLFFMNKNSYELWSYRLGGSDI